jgi:O-antigen ligase
MKLSIIVPAYNEEDNIGRVIKEIESSLDLEHELVVVNDHSTDRTFDLVTQLSKEYPAVRLVNNSGQKGFANALRTGFLNSCGEVILPIMGDLCDDLGTVKKMYDKIREGYDIVCGSRYMRGGSRLGGSKLKSFLSSLGGKSLYHILRIPTHDIANAFKMYRKAVIQAVNTQSSGFEISMELPLKAHYLGFKITEVPTVWKERTKGKSSFKIFKLLPSYIKLYTWGIFKSFLEGKGALMRDKILSLTDKAIYWEIIFIPFVASFSSAAVDIFIGLLIFTFLIKKFTGKNKDISFGILDIPFALLMLISLLSFVNSISLHSSIQGMIKLLKYGLLIVILGREVKDREHFKKIILAAVFGLFIGSLDAIYQLICGVDLFRHRPYDSVLGLARLKGAFPHTNIFAGYLVLFLPVFSVLFLYCSRGRYKLYLGIVSASALFCLIFTFCRSAVLGFWLAMLIIGFMKKDKLVIAVLVGAVLIAPLLAPKSITNWSKKTSSVAEFLLNKERLVLYETSFNMIKHHPILGVGVNTYCLNYQKYKLHDTDEGTANTMWYAHNSYLQMASEIGIIGLLVFLYLLVKLFKGWRGFYRKVDDNFEKIASLGIFMGIFAFLIHGLTETNLYYPKIATLFWFQVGLLASLLYLKKKGVK